MAEDRPEGTQPFAVYDCSLVMRATGQRVSNLRELYRAVQDMDSFALEHHMMRCHLGDWFMLEEFPNDLARWCWRDLDDHSSGERLALIDPYRHPTFDSLRREILDVIEERLWLTSQSLTSCAPGTEFHVVGSQLVAYETGLLLETPVALAEQMPRMSLRSLYYHVHDARLRTAGQTDDFSAWLEKMDGTQDLVRAIRQIDFHFLNLRQLRASLLEAFQTQFPVHPLPLGALS